MRKLTTISTSTLIRGAVLSKNDLRFEGHLQGTLKNEGRLVLAKDSRVVGACEAVECKADGHIDGNITVSHRLHVGPHAHICAAIETQEIHVDVGGKINGTITMTD